MRTPEPSFEPGYYYIHEQTSDTWFTYDRTDPSLRLRIVPEASPGDDPGIQVDRILADGSTELIASHPNASVEVLSSETDLRTEVLLEPGTVILGDNVVATAEYAEDMAEWRAAVADD